MHLILLLVIIVYLVGVCNTLSLYLSKSKCAHNNLVRMHLNVLFGVCVQYDVPENDKVNILYESTFSQDIRTYLRKWKDMISKYFSFSLNDLLRNRVLMILLYIIGLFTNSFLRKLYDLHIIDLAWKKKIFCRSKYIDKLNKS